MSTLTWMIEKELAWREREDREISQEPEIKINKKSFVSNTT